MLLASETPWLLNFLVQSIFLGFGFSCIPLLFFAKKNPDFVQEWFKSAIILLMIGHALYWILFAVNWIVADEDLMLGYSYRSYFSGYYWWVAVLILIGQGFLPIAFWKKSLRNSNYFICLTGILLIFSQYADRIISILAPLNGNYVSSSWVYYTQEDWYISSMIWPMLSFVLLVAILIVGRRVIVGTPQLSKTVND